MAVDVIAFFASFYVAMGIVNHTWKIHNFISIVELGGWLSIGMWILIFARVGMYRRSLAVSSRDEIYYTIAALTVGILPQLILFTVVPTLSTSRLLLIVAVCLATLGVGGARAIVHLAIRIEEDRTFRRILVVSPCHAPAAMNGERGIPAQWSLMPYRSDIEQAANDSPEAILERIAWFRAAARDGCDMVLIESLLPPRAAAHVADLAARGGVEVRFAPPELQQSAFEVRIDRRAGQTLLEPVPLGVLSAPAEFCKSVLDRSIAFVALCALSPLLVATAIAIRLEGPGPALFSQLRVGRNGRSFNVFKFRSMRVDAGSSWATTNDNRITRVGAFIRKYSIDELPQLLNVLRGEMSLVGPRPEMREYADRFALQFPRYAERHLVRPGITGWTQINMRRNLTPGDVEEVLESDLFYIENWSFLLDLSILFKTACEIFFHRGV